VISLLVHPEAALERRRAVRKMRSPDAAVRFDQALNALFDRIERDSNQFPEHGLLAVQNGRTLLFAIRRAMFPKPFPYVVFFYVRQTNAIILAIAHAKRRPGYWVDRR
jgi:plasmid stabilization system protein ParE